MKFVLLGTNGYHPNDERHTACMMIPELGIILDAGTAMYRVREWIQTDSLNIFLTHAHLDHVIGLTYLFDVLHGHNVQDVRVHGDAEKLQQIQQHLFAEALFPVMVPCEWHPLGTEVELPASGRLTHFPLEHPGGSLGFRLDWPDRSMAYVTDTVARPEAAYVEKIRGVDLLVHECYFTDEFQEQAELTGHSWTTAVAQVAAAAGVRRLLLVHSSPRVTGKDPVGVDTARAIFPETTMGHDRMEVEF